MGFDAKIDTSIFMPFTVLLNDFFAESWDDIPTALSVLKSFDSNKDVAKILKVYDPEEVLDLDLLCARAKVSPADFRRMLIVCLDILCTDLAEQFVARAKPGIIYKSLEVAMDQHHPDSHAERRGWLERYGYRLMPKIAPQTSININNQQANLPSVVVPSFGTTMAGVEGAANERLKQLTSGPEVIDITPEVKKAKNRGSK